MASINLISNQKVELTAAALDSKGVQVNFTAPPVWTSSDSSVAGLVAISAADPQPPAGQYSMWLVPLKAGDVTVTVTEDAVLGDPTSVLTATQDFVISAPVDLAASIMISAGSAVSQ